MFIFSIPHNFTSPKGNLSFEYFFAGDGSDLSVKVCREASESAFTIAGTGGAMLDTVVVPYSCASKMDVEVCNARNYFLVFFYIVPSSMLQAC